ncbi:MAG: hypothetical protein AB9903_32005 [Vulcanimicrobiota bacterium]
MFVPGPEEIIIGGLVAKSITYVSEVPFFVKNAGSFIKWTQEIETAVKEGRRAKTLAKEELDIVIKEGRKYPEVKLEPHGPHPNQNPPYLENHISVQPGGPKGPASKAHLNIPDGYTMP